MTAAKQYRVVSTADPYVSPFEDLVWDTREAAQRFADKDAPDNWAGKLTVVEVEADATPYIWQPSEPMPSRPNPSPGLAAPLPFEPSVKPGQIAVNIPGCDKCGKIFLECKCGGDSTEPDVAGR